MILLSHIGPMKLFALLTPALLLVSCAGYQMGGSKPSSLVRVKTIAVPMFVNSTLQPRAEVLATSAVADAFLQDGTYRISKRDQADAVLEGDLRSIRYAVKRSARYDTLRPEELSNTVSINWRLLDARDPTKVLATGTSTGSSELFARGNIQTAKNNALPEACERAATSLVSRLADGY